MNAGNLIKVVGIIIMIISILLGIAIGVSAERSGHYWYSSTYYDETVIYIGIGVGFAGIIIGIFLICLGLIICDTINLNLQINELSKRLIETDNKNNEEIKRVTARDEALLALLTTIEQKTKVSTITPSKFEYKIGDNTSHPRFEGEGDEEYKKRIENL